MKHLAPLTRLTILAALTALPTACGGGGSGSGGSGSTSGRMYVQTCVLGCNNGASGNQVGCGIVNTFENQDIAIQFSRSVNLNYVKNNPAAFRVFEITTGTAPPGEIVIDPADDSRLIFRPKLSFSPQGVPSFGFATGASYQIYVRGTVQGDPPPYVRSTGGKNNESRMLCSITTDQGITDAVPGKPQVEIYLEELDGLGGTNTVEINDLDPLRQVSSTSPITFVFRDIMDLGTIVTPITRTAPSPGIEVKIDPDGNLADPTDQFPWDGLYCWDVDQDLLVTTIVFYPTPTNPTKPCGELISGGWPSGGSMAERKVVVTIPSAVQDLVQNSVANTAMSSGDPFNFTPEVLNFGPVSFTENFLGQTNKDVERTGADWGESLLGRLRPGTGGGSGRLGDLEVGANQTQVLYTSPQHATAWIEYDVAASEPTVNAGIVLGDGLGSTAEFVWRNETGGMFSKDNNDLIRRKYTSYSLAEAANVLNGDDPTYTMIPSWVNDKVTYGVDGNRLTLTYDDPGEVGNTFELVTSDPAFTGHSAVSGTTLTGGVDAMSFGGAGEIGEQQIVTNFDFQANPGATPPPITIDDGVFEFARVDIETDGTLQLLGDNPARLLARGRFYLRDDGVIDVSGTSPSPHSSDAPWGQEGTAGGPGGSSGAQGAFRPENDTGMMTLLTLPEPPASPTFDAGLVNPRGLMKQNGNNGLGVGKNTGSDGGRRGNKWPPGFPTEVYSFANLAVDANCVSEQVGGPGGGGAYATDGGIGVAKANNAVAIEPAGASNTPADAGGGVSSGVGLPPAGPIGATGQRTLHPEDGFLLGGSAGGSGGSSITGTMTNMSGGICLDFSGSMTTTPIGTYWSHSGAASGSGGGALQIVGGDEAQVIGRIDASGGDGGGNDDTAVANGRDAPPGGGGSGGAVLVQSELVNVTLSSNRFLLAGGAGGTGPTHGSGEFSKAGDGGVGLLRVEDNSSGSALFGPIAQTVDAFDPTVIDQADPSEATAAIHWLSADVWDRSDEVPGSFSAAQSCWMEPGGNVISVTFDGDNLPGDPGWDMQIFFSGSPTPVSYRTSTVFGGNSPQVEWGELFNDGTNPGAPVVVRFQGAQASGALADPCNADPGSPLSPIDPESVTPWVRHPEELNAFSPPVSIIRFMILFDAAHPQFGTIQGITNVVIDGIPE